MGHYTFRLYFDLTITTYLSESKVPSQVFLIKYFQSLAIISNLFLIKYIIRYKINITKQQAHTLIY